MDRTDRLLLIAITILHLLAQVYLYVNPPTHLQLSGHEPQQVAPSPGVVPLTYEESFRYTTTLYPFLPPDTVWLKRSD